MRETLTIVSFTILLGLQASLGNAQEAAPVPITGAERIDWIVDGVVGTRSLGVGVLAATWQTAVKTPEEWPRSAVGFTKRYMERDVDVAISSAIEAELGALWGEDPRYHRAPALTARARMAYAFKTVMLAPRPDGQLKPAWGRFAGNIFNNVIENAWLPPSVTTPRETALRSGEGLLGRLAGNLWDEFWPDIRSRLGHRLHHS